MEYTQSNTNNFDICIKNSTFAEKYFKIRKNENCFCIQ